MKSLIILSILIGVLISCNETEEDNLDDYYINFTVINESKNESTVNIKYDQIKNITGNSVNGEDYAWIGFSIRGIFTAQSVDEELATLDFHLSTKVPEAEFLSDSDEFINPENFLDYLPSGNVFNDENISFSTYYQEPLESYCSGINDENFENYFDITDKKFFIDENEDEAIIVEGTFTTKYNSICEEYGSFELTKGAFRIKVLMDKKR